MRDWRERLSREEGVSILYGILFMLVAVFVASLMLGAASTAAVRADSEQDRNQDSLVLRCASNLVRDCLENTAFDLVIVTDGATGKPIVQSVTAVNSGTNKNLCDELLGSIRKASGASSSTHTSEPDSGDFQVTVAEGSGVPEALAGSVVDVEYTVKLEKIVEGDSGIEFDEYRIDATLTLKDGNQRMFLTAYKRLNPNDLGTQRLSWSHNDITLGTTKEAKS